MIKIKKLGKAAAYTAAYFAELAAVTYYGIKLKEKYDEGDISTARYAIEGTVMTLGSLAVSLPICMKGSGAIFDVIEDLEDEEDELEFLN